MIELPLYKKLKEEFLKAQGNTADEFNFYSILCLWMKEYILSVYLNHNMKVQYDLVLPDFLTEIDLRKHLEQPTCPPIVVTSPYGGQKQIFNPGTLNIAAMKEIIKFCEENNYDVTIGADSLHAPGAAVNVEFEKKEESRGEDQV